MPKFTISKNDDAGKPGYNPDPWQVLDFGGVIVSTHATRDEARANARMLNESEGSEEQPVVAYDNDGAPIRGKLLGTKDTGYANPVNAYNNFKDLAENATTETARVYWQKRADMAKAQADAEAPAN